VIPAVVLAAGLSSRMGGQPKALLTVDGTDSFLTRVVRTFISAGVNDVVVVLGHQAEWVARAIVESRLPVRMVVNPSFETGQLSSLLTGLNFVDRPGVSAMLMTLVDVPLVGADTVKAVLDRYRTTGASIVRPVRGEDHGHPVLIDRSLFSDLRAADPSEGAKPIVRAHVSPAGDVPVDDPGAFIDIDTPADYAHYCRTPI
jgi:CTP:molybdopterin cytidylyltransferase MocA